jgi:hypothetical protein
MAIAFANRSAVWMDRCRVNATYFKISFSKCSRPFFGKSQKILMKYVLKKVSAGKDIKK